MSAFIVVSKTLHLDNLLFIQGEHYQIIRQNKDTGLVWYQRVHPWPGLTQIMTAHCLTFMLTQSFVDLTSKPLDSAVVNAIVGP